MTSEPNRIYRLFLVRVRVPEGRCVCVTRILQEVSSLDFNSRVDSC